MYCWVLIAVLLLGVPLPGWLQYEGTHNFHNYTIRKPASAPDAKRYILSFRWAGGRAGGRAGGWVGGHGVQPGLSTELEWGGAAAQVVARQAGRLTWWLRAWMAQQQTCLECREPSSLLPHTCTPAPLPADTPRGPLPAGARVCLRSMGSAGCAWWSSGRASCCTRSASW